MTRRLASVLALALIGLAAGPTAMAEDAFHARKMGLVQRTGVLLLYYSAADLVTSVEKKLDSGLPQRIVAQHFVHRVGRLNPVAAGGHTCRIVYDLWQAVYLVQYEVFGAAPKSYTYQTRDEVIDRCLVMRGFAVASAHDVGSSEEIYLTSVVELNPLSAKTLARIRRWLAKSRADHGADGKSFFGSFVSLFVNDRIGSAERVLRLRSQRVRLRSWR